MMMRKLISKQLKIKKLRVIQMKKVMEMEISKLLKNLWLLILLEAIVKDDKNISFYLIDNTFFYHKS